MHISAPNEGYCLYIPWWLFYKPMKVINYISAKACWGITFDVKFLFTLTSTGPYGTVGYHHQSRLCTGQFQSRPSQGIWLFENLRFRYSVNKQNWKWNPTKKLPYISVLTSIAHNKNMHHCMQSGRCLVHKCGANGKKMSSWAWDLNLITSWTPYRL